MYFRSVYHQTARITDVATNTYGDIIVLLSEGRWRKILIAECVVAEVHHHSG